MVKPKKLPQQNPYQPKPPITVSISYKTAASLNDMLCSAYVQLERSNPELYKEITETVRPFWEHLIRYLDSVPRK